MGPWAKICARELASVVSRGFQGPPVVSRGSFFLLIHAYAVLPKMSGYCYSLIEE